MNDQVSEQEKQNSISDRALQKMRARGVEYGVDIPVPKYPLTRDTASGLVLKIMTALSAVLIAANLGLLIWAVAKILVPLINSALYATDLADSIKNIPVINLLGAMPMIVVWTLVIGIVLILGGVAIGALVYLFRLIKTNHLSIEEKAVGHYLSSTRTSALTLGIVLVFASVAALLFVPNKLFGILFLISAIYAIALFVVLQKTRKRTKAVFAQLPTEQQNDFIAFDRAVSALNSHRAMRKNRQLNGGGYHNMGKFGWILALLDGFIETRFVYNNVKKSDEFRPISTGLARRALGQLLHFALTCLITGVLFYFAVNFIFANIEFFQIIAMILGFVIFLGQFLITLPQILNANIKQLRLNKQPLGKIALATTIVVTVAVVIVTILVIMAIKA